VCVGVCVCVSEVCACVCTYMILGVVTTSARGIFGNNRYSEIFLPRCVLRDGY